MKQLTTSFEQQDLVWAKIENYPWWPGKIIEIFEQKKSLFFKISFYADPTYSYLQENALIPYQDFSEHLNASYSLDSKLRKAIDLAKNAFLKKNQTIQRKNTSLHHQTEISNFICHAKSQIFQENYEKQAEQYQQSTIHADFLNQNQIKDFIIEQKSVDIQGLLQKYRLDSIPSISKQSKQIQKNIKCQVNSMSCESQSQDPNQEFQIKKIHKSKNTKAKVFRRFITKKNKAQSLTEQERKIKFMKKFCSFLIQKQFESSFSRQITVQVIKKVEELKQKAPLLSQKQTMDQNEFFVKYFESLNKIDFSLSNEQKLVQIFNSIQITFYRGKNMEKYEQQKTQTAYLNSQIEEIC